MTNSTESSEYGIEEPAYILPKDWEYASPLTEDIQNMDKEKIRSHPMNPRRFIKKAEAQMIKS